MDIQITPGPLSGWVEAPPSKSAAHRAAICGALTRGRTTVGPVQDTDDMKVTADAAVALGASAQRSGDSLLVQGIHPDRLPDRADIDCNESGSSLRFFIPIAAALGVPTLFRGRGNLPNRPLTPLLDALSAHGVSCTSPGGRDGRILEIAGRLQSGVFLLPGDISSQYITGLLFALPLCQGDSEIHLTTPLQSRGYVDMTLQALADSGIVVHASREGWRIPGGQQYHSPATLTVEADYSGAAFWLCAGAMGKAVTVRGLRPDSLQGDRAILGILEEFGARVSVEGTAVTVAPGALRGIEMDATHIPDLVPVLAAVAACAEGETVIRGVARLRIKESDRLESVSAGLNALGGQVRVEQDRLVIRGVETLAGGQADSYADHRIAMAMSIAAIRCQSPVVITGAQCVAKSYTEFYDHYRLLGGNCNVV